MGNDSSNGFERLERRHFARSTPVSGLATRLQQESVGCLEGVESLSIAPCGNGRMPVPSGP
eukprot:12836194-Alexandrium_andersonii.AAC.1